MLEVDDRLSVLGVGIANVSMPEAIETVSDMLRRRDGGTRSVYFVNACALNIAASDRAYHDVLNRGDRVFGDGTGVRWAAKLRGVRMRDNVNGTDLVPTLFAATAGLGFRCFLLGADEDSIGRAAEHAAAAFPGWTFAGHHHGFLSTPEIDAQAVAAINDARPDLLLVGMGNPLQERWIDAHRTQLAVPVCMGVGGLFQYWAGALQRAPRWLRMAGLEWLGILAQQPKKARRYLIGNPLFLARVLSSTRRERHGK